MDRESVVSSNVKSIGYDQKEDILEVEFNGGGVYQYKGVPMALYENLMQAESKGKFINQFIKNQYPFEKMPLEHWELT